MSRCPNCGQKTSRTEDWACPSCGYPLLSPSYKKITKTYKQFQAEKSSELKTPLAEYEPEVEPEPESAPEPEVEPVLEPELKQIAEPMAEPEPTSAPELEVEPVPEPESIPEPEVEPMPEPEIEPVPEPESIPEPEVEPVPEPELKQVVEPVAAPEPESAPEPAPEAVAEAEPVLEPESASGAIVITVAQLNSMYNADRAAANAKLTNKALRITGVVKKVVVREHLGIQYMLLASSGNQGHWNVRCTFDEKHGSGLKKLTSGETATVQGEYAGYERNIILKNCVLTN